MSTKETLPSLTTAKIATRVLRHAAPVALSSLLYALSQTVVLAYAGDRLGTAGQASYAIAVSIFNIIGMSIGCGFLTCLDTLCSQAYGRNPEGRELSVLVLRAMVIVLLLCIPLIAMLMLVVVPVLRMVYPGEVGEGAARYFDFAPLYLVINCMALGIQRALQAQRASHLVLVAYIISTGAAPFFAQRIVTAGDVGTGALANVATAAVLLFLLVAIALWHPASRLNRLPPGFTWRMVLDRNECVNIFQLGTAACVACACDWWGLEVTLLAVSTSGARAADDFAVTVNVLLGFIAVYQGLSNCLAVSVGNALGAAKPTIARAWRNAICGVAVFALVFDTVVFLHFADAIFRFFSRDPAVLRDLHAALGLVVLYHFVDAAQLIAQGVFRGAGEQRVSGRVSMAAVWLLGVPAAFAARWYCPSEPFRAPLLGYTVGVAVIAPALFTLTNRWDWEALAIRAHHQVVADGALAIEGDSPLSVTSRDPHLRQYDSCCDNTAP